MKTLGIVRRLIGCYYCGRPIRGRAEVCGYCSDLPLKDPMVKGVRERMTEAELFAASRNRGESGAATPGAWAAALELYRRGVDTPFSRWMESMR